MTEVHDIRKLYFEKGHNITQIARQTGKDRKTIRMYLGKEDWNMTGKNVVHEADFPKLEPYKAEIDSWLIEDKKFKHKQRHTAKLVDKRLAGQHPDEFDCSYRTVAGYVAMRKQEIYQRPAGYLPLEHSPGEAQGDFGEAEFYENGQHYIGKYLNLSFPHSNHGYLQLFKGENQECLFEGLISIFEHIGGVPQQIWFDNTRTIVSKVMKEGGRELTNAYSPMLFTTNGYQLVVMPMLTSESNEQMKRDREAKEKAEAKAKPTEQTETATPTEPAEAIASEEAEKAQAVAEAEAIANIKVDKPKRKRSKTREPVAV